jgi:hypothetical protein
VTLGLTSHSSLRTISIARRYVNWPIPKMLARWFSVLLPIVNRGRESAGCECRRPRKDKLRRERLGWVDA